MRHKGVRLTRHRLVPRGPEQAPEQHAERARALVARLPERTLQELAADAGMPLWLSEPFARHIVARRGDDRFLRAAASHRTSRGRWKRIAALRILCAVRHPDSLALLEAGLLSGDADVTGAAVSLLGNVPSRDAAALLVRALRERLHPPSRVAARLDTFPLAVPDLLIALVHDADPILRYWGATLMARYAEGAGVPAALAALASDADASVRKAAVESLGVVGGDDAAPTAVRLLADPVFYVRAHAARALGDLERPDLAAHVLPLLADTEWWVRAAAKDSLLAMGPRVMPVLVPVLDGPDRFARNGAAEVLQNLGVLDHIAGRVEAGMAEPDERALLEKAVAEGGLIAEPGIARRRLPAVSNRMRTLLRSARARLS